MRTFPLFILLIVWPAARAAEPGVSPEIARLEARVAELERQNRQMLELLKQMEARLNGAAAAEPKPASASSVVPAPRPASKAGFSPAPAPAPAPASAPAALETITEGGSGLRVYGMLRMDMDIDTQRPNNAQTPLFVTSPDAGRGGSFSMHPRLTRFGVSLRGPHLEALGNAAISGQLETDFENGGSESRQIIRIRHAYLKAAWGGFSVLAGQTWDVFSPLFPTVNNDTLMWTAGNVGDRRPQLRATWEPRVGKTTFSLSSAMGLAGAVDALDLDGNGYRDGEQSMRPNLQSRAAVSLPLWVAGQPASVGGSMFYGWLGITQPTGARTLLPSSGYNVDYSLPLAAPLALRGEAWWGRNMGDFRGGAGQSFLAGRPVRGRGGWSELKVRVNRFWSIAPGFTTDNPVLRDLTPGSRARNRAFYFGNRFTPGGKIEFGVDYLRWQTDYVARDRGTDNRFNLFLQYGF